MTGDRATADAGAFQAEVDRVCASAAFARAPVMRRLLRFLVEQTLAGNGDTLKAYGVAVDGLGRSADFDPQTDSYPRVQVGRLRRMIAQHYANGHDPGVARLHIPSGGYRVDLTTGGAEEQTASSGGHVPPIRADRPRHWLIIGAAAVLAAAGLSAGAFAIWRAPDPTVAKGNPPRPLMFVPPPELEIVPIRTAEEGDVALAQRIDRILGDALHRSWSLNVRARDNPASKADYRLTGTLVGAERKLLYLGVWDNETRTQIWSDRIDMRGRDRRVRETLGRTISTIMSPTGVIGSRERRQSNGDFTPGFPCMMRFTDFFITGSNREAARLHLCLDQTLRLSPGYGPAMAAQMTIRYREGSAHPERAAAIRKDALIRGAAAVQADPYSADAHMALSRAAYFNGQCERGRVSAERALELNPYDAQAHALAGVSLFECGDPSYETHLSRARDLDPALPAVMSIPTIIGMYERGEGKAALRFAQTLSSGVEHWRARYALTMAIGYAAAGDMAAARANWSVASKAVAGGRATSPTMVIQHILFSPGLTRRSEAWLQARGVFATRASDGAVPVSRAAGR